jgi:hypothetical protein
MEVLTKAQSFVTENALIIGMVLLVVVLLVSALWFTMLRNQNTSPVLENKARVNEATTAPTEELPTQEQLEEMARYREQMESQQQPDNAPSE